MSLNISASNKHDKETGVDGYDPGSVVIKDEPPADDSYGITSPEYSKIQTSKTDDPTTVSKNYPEETSESSLDNCDVKFSSALQGPSSNEGDDYNVMSVSYSDAEDDSEDMSNGQDRKQGEVFSSEDGGSFRVVPAGDYSSDEERDTENESGIGMTIKEEGDDDGYDFACSYSSDFVKEEVPSPGIEPMFDQGGTYTEQDDQSEENSDNCYDKICEKEAEPRRTRRKRHKPKRRDSFEYEDEDSTGEELAKPSALVRNTNMPVENVSLTPAEFEDCMVTDRDQMERRKEIGKQDKRPVTDIQDAIMIAQYAIFDPQKSEMVGIKSVNPKKCQICDKEFQYEFHVKFHMQQVHPETLESDKRSNEHDSLLWQRMQGNNPRARYSKTCFICMNKVYTHPYYLNLHMQEMHPEWLIDNKMIQNLTADDETDSSLFKVCPVCFEGFRFAYQLKYHIQKKHAEILVEDKRVDTSKLPSRTESEFPIEDYNVTDNTESIRPNMSAVSREGIKLTYTVKDLLNIKKSLEKEKAAKDAKEAQRLAKSLEPKKKQGRPQKSAADKMGKISHIHKTTILRRGPGRPRKNPDSQKHNKLASKISAMCDKAESVSERTKDFEAVSQSPMSQDSSPNVTLPHATASSASNDGLPEVSTSDSTCGILIKEEPNSDDEYRSLQVHQSHLLMVTNDEPASDQRKTHEDGHSVQSVNDSENDKDKQIPGGHQFHMCDSVDEKQKTETSQDKIFEKDGLDDEMELVQASAASNVISFEGEKHLMSSNARLEFKLSMSESSTSGFALTDNFEETSVDATEKVNLKSEYDMKNVSADHKPKRKRKKKDLKDMLALNSAPKKERENKEKGHAQSKEVEKETGNKSTKPKCLKILGPSSRKKGRKPRPSRSKKLHLQANSQQNRYCSTCGKIFLTVQTFKDHEQACMSGSLESQSPSGYYPCKHCSVVFHHNAAYQLHMFKEHPDSSKTCPFCGKLFAFPSVLKKHMFIHTNEAVKKALSAVKDDTKPGNNVTTDKDSKLVSIMTSLGVQKEKHSGTPDNQCGALELSVPFKSMSNKTDSLKSLNTEECSEAESSKREDTVHSKETIIKSSNLKELESSATCKSASESPGDSSQGRSHIRDLSVRNKKSLPFAALKEHPNHPQSSLANPNMLSDGASLETASLSVTDSSQLSLASSSKSPTSSNPTLAQATSTASSASTSTETASMVRVGAEGLGSADGGASDSVQYSTKTYSCKICSAEFPNIALLYKHELGEHIKHVCPHCKKGFAYEATLKKHVLIHQTNPSKFNCIWCGRVFSYLNRFKSHLLTHNGTVCSHKLNCKKCTKVWFDVGGKLPFEVQDSIGSHLQDCFEDSGGDMDEMLNSYMSSGAKNESQKCLECDKSYTVESEHSRNVLMSHVYKCKICDKDFPDTDLLKEHVFEHHNEATGFFGSYKRNRAFNCGSCSAKFPSLFNFMCHMTAHKKAFRGQQSDKSGVQGPVPQSDLRLS